MKLPFVPSGGGVKRVEEVQFGGLNLREGAGAGELTDSKNLSSDLWPALSSREGRIDDTQTLCAPSSVFSFDGLCVVDGSDFLYNGTLAGSVTPGRKQFAVVGNKLCIFPDKKYLDLSSKTFQSLEASVTAIPGSATFSQNTITLAPNHKIADKLVAGHARSYTDRHQPATTLYQSVAWDNESHTWNTAGRTPIVNMCMENYPWEGLYFIPMKTEYGDYAMQVEFLRAGVPKESYNTDGIYGVIYKSEYREGDTSESIHLWAYLYDGKTKNPSLLTAFRVGDAVQISDTALPANHTTAIIRALTADSLTFDSNIFTAITGSHVTISRKVPDLDFICESGNRLWGVSNRAEGKIWNAEKKTFDLVHARVIYVSALGDPTNFFVYDGLSTDSYAVAVGSEGAFTGICDYSDAVHCWKENRLHKVFGRYPAEYQMADYHIPGVACGSAESLQVIHETLYYHAREGVMAYSGGAPSLISYPLGFRPFQNAAAGGSAAKYYISMQDDTGQWGLYCYDTIHKIWLKEDETKAVQFTYFDHSAYCVTGDKLLRLNGGDEPVSWCATFAPGTEGTLRQKRYRGFTLRLELFPKSSVRLEMRTDGGVWKEIWQSGFILQNRVITIPVNVPNCDQSQWRISGEGKCILRALLRKFTIGGTI